jgi:7,8-dihydropterin-6-yl-methyl-4-(beta-D-ribofuranosyl)aminobenzene 5'-phosphate synthase
MLNISKRINKVISMRKIQSLRITTIADNIVQSGGLGQWGLSFLLELVDAENEKRKVLFDTSNNKEAFFHNVKLLKIDFKDLDCIVISHGHADHTTATVEVVEKTGGVIVYGHPHTFLPRFYIDKDGKRRSGGPPKGEGLDDIEKAGGKAVLTSEPVEVVPGLWTTGQVDRVTSFERISPPVGDGGKRIIIVEGKEVEDKILDDQALWMDIADIGPFVVTGCAHAGAINTLLNVQKLGGFTQLHGLVGGTHLVGRSDEYVKKTIDELRRFKLGLVSPCHCTGFKSTTRIWQEFPDIFILNYCLRVIEAGKEPDQRVI